MALVWLALAVSFAAVLTAAVMTTRRGLALLRDAKRVGAGISTELEAIERSTAEIEGHLAAATASGEALSKALEQLATSRARLNVLLAAIADVSASVALVTGFIPRK
jgi:hypothetical protein